MLRRVKRDTRTVQFGVHPLRAITLNEVSLDVGELIDGLDGTRDLGRVLDDAADKGFDRRQVEELITLLDIRGLLDDAGVSPAPLRHMPLAESERLQPELDALAISPQVRDGGLGVLARRRAARVRVYGAGRVGAQVCALLATSGVGALDVIDPAPARRRDVVPGGLSWSEVALPRQDGAVALARRLAPSVDACAGERAGGSRPDLVVLATVGPLDRRLVAALHGQGVPHLLTSAYEGYGAVGPLVLPGRTACIHCMELTRRDRDPTWPTVTTRLGGFPPGEIACDAVLSTLVAAEAAGHVLAFLDGRPQVVTNGTVDVLPDWRWRRRTWNPHQSCRCTQIHPGH
ncbi:hypothetical protein Ssi02_32580 [Sinosporangium siamense]|uniref:THIF-type NAD/FAD binding fold domain-containing protein n=1 Tax=Sinosporangium siamense TaxID=1367973 RepID=A0A919RGN1_9ACTN|nr:hypothetical protein Ssi02_32580 [Sinosporangium siamense]